MSSINPKTARVVIYQGNDLSRLEELDQAVTTAEASLRTAERAAEHEKRSAASRTLDEDQPAGDSLHAARERHEDAVFERDLFAEEAEARGVVVALHALPRRKWRELVREHPPRDSEPDDAIFGVNMDSFPDVLLPLSIDREQSTVQGDLEGFLDSVSNFDYYDRLFVTALSLNRGSASADPTRRLGSMPSQT